MLSILTMRGTAASARCRIGLDMTIAAKFENCVFQPSKM